MHRQSAARLGMLHVRGGAAGASGGDLGPLGVQHGGLRSGSGGGGGTEASSLNCTEALQTHSVCGAFWPL